MRKLLFLLVILASMTHAVSAAAPWTINVISFVKMPKIYWVF